MRGPRTLHAAPWRDPWIAAALLVALALRVAMGRGGLWLDEAWSAVMAHDVGTPLGVLAGINHDNNHPLNSWWLQLVGFGAPPLLARLLSISCSVFTIVPAAEFAGRRGAWSGRAAAWLFALSPMLVLLGSEARGYASALLAVVLLVNLVDPLRNDSPSSATSLALIGLLGTLGHVLMLPTIFLVCLWLWLGGSPWRTAVRTVGPALLAALCVVALLLGLAYVAQGGLRIGSSTPFAWPGFAAALVELAHLTLGAAPLFLLAIIIGARPTRTDFALWMALGLGFPVAAALLHLPNSQISRYFVISSIALLWLVATRVGAPVHGKPSQRFAAYALVGAILLAMGVTDARLIASARGEPDLPVRRIAAAHRGPTGVLISADPLSAIVSVAAAQQRVSVTSLGPTCQPADYLLAGLFEIAPPATVTHCGVHWSLLDYRLRPYRDGSGWVLYRRAGLPAPGPVASGPRPAL